MNLKTNTEEKYFCSKTADPHIQLMGTDDIYKDDMFSQRESKNNNKMTNK